jgi:hypothetical protein
MRYVTDVPTATTNPFGRQVGGLSAVYAVKAVHPREQTVAAVEHQAEHQQGVHAVEQQNQRHQPIVERRKACRRVAHQHVLIELRSGIDRRHHNLRDGDVVEHIDIEA